MKSGRHPEKMLTAATVRSIKEPGRYTDGNGLYLVVDPSGARRWVLRTVVQGKRRDIGLGGTSLVSLAEAREHALEYRKIARKGGDPIANRQNAKIQIPTFSEAAKTVHASQQATWDNRKHAAQWINTLETYAVPIIGDMKVSEIATPDILKVLAPIWLTKSETARRVKQRLNTVLDWAKVAGFREGDNPVDGVGRGLPKQGAQTGHHEAMPYTDVPAFIVRLRGVTNAEASTLALELLILTATRTSEVLLAQWQEINFDKKVWTIPAARMKARKEHRVPLTTRAIAILERAMMLAGNSDWLFPGRMADKPSSNMLFNMILRRMKIDATAHGFRSSFRDWAAEETSFPGDVAEMALAHTIGNKVEAAYRRGDLFDKRRDLMEAWASFVSAATSHCDSDSVD